jgi:hypothetical protein
MPIGNGYANVRYARITTGDDSTVELAVIVGLN